MGQQPQRLAPYSYTSTFSEVDRIAAVDRAEREGATVVARDLGVSPATIRSWRMRLGRSMSPRQLGQRAFAIRARSMRVADMRSQLQHDFLAVAWAIVGRMLDTLDEHSPRDLRDLIISAATALDKFRLEAGESTGRHEQVTIDAARERLASFLGTTPDQVEEVVAERVRMRRRTTGASVESQSRHARRADVIPSEPDALSGSGAKVPDASPTDRTPAGTAEASG